MQDYVMIYAFKMDADKRQARILPYSDIDLVLDRNARSYTAEFNVSSPTKSVLSTHTHTHTLMMMFECSLQQPNDVRKTLNSLSDSDFKMCSLHVFLSSWLLGMAPV